MPRTSAGLLAAELLLERSRARISLEPSPSNAPSSSSEGIPAPACAGLPPPGPTAPTLCWAHPVAVGRAFGLGGLRWDLANEPGVAEQGFWRAGGCFQPKPELFLRLLWEVSQVAGWG